MRNAFLDSLKCRRSLEVAGKTYHYYSLPDAAAQLGDISRLPTSLKVLLENLLRWEDDVTVRSDDLRSLVSWLQTRSSTRKSSTAPPVLMQDFTGVPAVVDLAAMRDAVARAGGDPQKINPLSPVDTVIDHSVMVDRFGSDQAFEQNVEIEMQRNGERYEFLRWGQQAFDNFSVVPPGTGICHRVSTNTSAGCLDPRRERRNRRLPGHPGRHRFAHHHDQWPRRTRLGCRRHRGRSGDARPTGIDADS